MTNDEFFRAQEIQAKIKKYQNLLTTFGLDVELYKTNLDEFRDRILNNQEKFEDSAVEYIGASFKAMLEADIQALEEEFNKL